MKNKVEDNKLSEYVLKSFNAALAAQSLIYLSICSGT